MNNTINIKEEEEEKHLALGKVDAVREGVENCNWGMEDCCVNVLKCVVADLISPNWACDLLRCNSGDDNLALHENTDLYILIN